MRPADYDSMSRLEVEESSQLAPAETVAWALVQGGALHIRDVSRGEPAYHYSSGNFGPGYVLVKGAVGNQKLFKFLVRQVALRLKEFTEFDFIAGLVTGGVPPSLILRDQLQQLQAREIPWVYIRDTRKSGGSAEHITGVQHLASGGVNPEIPLGSRGVVMEELTNYANSICNGAGVLRASGYQCETGFALLDYAQPEGIQALKENGLALRALITLPELLEAIEASGAFPSHLVDDFRWFQREPGAWMSHYNYQKKEHLR